MNAGALMTGQHPGAIWRRIDLQCHTPRDSGWDGSDPLPGGTDAAEAARQVWAQDFITAALERNLSIVAVTDHHDHAMLPYVLTAAAGSGITVLPGIEVTCRDNVQVLAIFDPATTPETWQRFLAKLPEVKPFDAAAGRIGVVSECGLNVSEVFDAVTSDTVLSPVTILIPHFGPPNAYKSLNGQGHAARARELTCDGVYIECAFNDLDQATIDKIQGKIADWGSRRRAIVATGDNKRASWDRLGAHECWIRLGEATIEGLRQAFLADEARITYSPPAKPSEFIVSVEIKSTLTGTEPVTITFNDGFNALIGGRGSGKSAVLEYIRFGLGRSEADIAQPGLQTRKVRERELALVNDTLAEGWVAVTLERQGIREVWRRLGSRLEEIEVVLPHGQERLTIPVAQRRFPARAFHQKELSTTMLDAEAATDNITGIAAAEVIEERRRIDAAIADAKRAVDGALIDVAAHWQATLELDQARSKVSDLERRLAAVKQQLEEGGVTAEDLAILADAPRYDRVRNYLDELSRNIDKDREQMRAIGPTLLSVDVGRHPDVTDFTPIRELAEKVSSARLVVQEQVATTTAEMDKIADAISTARAEFELEATEFRTRYQSAKQRQTAHGSLIAESERIADQMKAASAEETRAAETEMGRRSAQDLFVEARDKLAELVAERLGVLKSAAEQIAEKSSGSLKAREARDKCSAERVESLCALFEGSRFRDTEDHCREWVLGLSKAGAEIDWTAMCDRLVEVYRGKILAGSPEGVGADTAAALRQVLFNGTASITAQQMGRIYANLTDRSVGAILSATPRDGIALTYVSGRQDIPFAKASPGQQASALLRLLLRQSAGTLVIDQPEDDLDNHVIMDIVRQIRTSKSNRQLIFATHNPNLVVNGDADKVVAMRATVPEDRPADDAARIRVEADGAIETPEIRQAVTTVMEGGLAAFDLRARKYGVDALAAARSQ